ncbi:MAG: hypothetical protein H0V70_08760 [Ktedonobacteraceae bacterium]|nr:hypothetical protein [Ktedonobacteraceae bacterium]
MPKPPRLLVPMILFATLLTACTSVVPARISTGNRASGTKATVALVHQPIGTVDLRWNAGTGHLIVTIHLSGLTPSSTHQAHIHQGTCQATGAMLFALKPVMTTPLGVGTSRTVLDHVTDGIPVAGWSVTVYNGSQLTSADQLMPMACTAIGNVRHRSSVLFDFNPATVDQPASSVPTEEVS